MVDLCIFKHHSDILGTPGKGVHKFRMFDIAIMDLFFTLLIAYFLAYFCRTYFILMFIALFVLGQLLHLAFCVETTCAKWIKENIVSKLDQ